MLDLKNRSKPERKVTVFQLPRNWEKKLRGSKFNPSQVAKKTQAEKLAKWLERDPVGEDPMAFFLASLVNLLADPGGKKEQRKWD